MGSLVIQGAYPLKGQVRVSGSKNAALPIMAACLMCPSEVHLSGVPDLEDVTVMAEVLRLLGARVKREADQLIIDARDVNAVELPERISRKMRASNLVMGPLLSRFKNARVAYPGGCAIGSRPMDLHLKGFRDLGYNISEEFGFMEGKGTPTAGKEILLDIPSVGATENIIMAAVSAPGQTVIRNAAREPEIIDLQNFLNRMGARVRGAGLDTVRVEGVSRLHGVDYKIIPDRIEAGTFMAAAAIGRGDVFIENVIIEHLQPIILKLREMGLETLAYQTGVRVAGKNSLSPIDLKTMPYPGFPTDMQAQMMSLLATVPGTSMIVETIFENRFMHVQELRRMGAQIKIEGRAAIIKGKNHLEGAVLEATDLRAGAALIIAGLYAEGETEICRIDHIDRGYENIHLKLQGIGARIERKDD